MSKGWRVALMLPWLALVAMSFDIWSKYDRLPAVIASHFNAAGVANGFAPKQQFFTVIVPMAFGMVALFTFLASRFEKSSGLGWLLLVAEYWGAGLFLLMTHAILGIGLGQAKTLDFPFGFWSLVCGIALIVGEVTRISGVRQRADADHGRLIAEETHGSQKLGGMFAVVSLFMIALPTALGAVGPTRGIPAVVGVIILGCAIWAWTGFKYRITTAGLEIRMVGMPIRFVPAMDIESVRAKDCNPLTDFGGWGIRGIGKMRAYIWGGNRCVHLHTNAGDDIYLGSGNADGMVRELEQMNPVAHR